MADEKLVLNFLYHRLASHGLLNEGWLGEIVDTLEENKMGFTYQDVKVIQLNRDIVRGASERNAKELVLHEVAHALCGHGEHNLQWWDKLIDIGGRGVWAEYPERIKFIGVKVVY